MPGILADEILNAARSTLRVNDVSQAMLNSARERLKRQKLVERVNSREPGALPQPAQPSSAPAATPLQGPTTRATTELPTQSIGPIDQAPLPQQQQRTNVGGVGVENRFLISGDNVDERGRMRAAQDEIDSLSGQGGTGVDADAASRIREQLGVTVPPANPAARLEVSDANFKFSDRFLAEMDANLENSIATSKNYPNNIRPFAERFGPNAKLGDIIDDSWEVFKYYPSLRDINLKPLGIFDGFFGTKGAYDATTKTMFLPRNIGRPAERLEEVKSTIIHEVQHYIQDVEGWARGGNTTEFQNLFRGKYKDFKARRAAVKKKYEGVVERVNLLPEIQRFRSLAEDGLKLSNKEFEKKYTHIAPVKYPYKPPRKEALHALGYDVDTVMSRFLSMTYDEMATQFSKAFEYAKGREGGIAPMGIGREVSDELAQILALKKSLEKYTTIQEQIRMAGKIKKLDGVEKMSFEGYQKLFGEIEARQAQDRMNMTDAERAATPQEIMNIDPNETIVRQQNQDLKGNIVPGMSFEQGHIVFNGGPTSAIDKYVLSKIGSGEGGIARGWGLYFAQRPGVSVQYRADRAEDLDLIQGGFHENPYDNAPIYDPLDFTASLGWANHPASVAMSERLSKYFDGTGLDTYIRHANESLGPGDRKNSFFSGITKQDFIFTLQNLVEGAFEHFHTKLGVSRDYLFDHPLIKGEFNAQFEAFFRERTAEFKAEWERVLNDVGDRIFENNSTIADDVRHMVVEVYSQFKTDKASSLNTAEQPGLFAIDLKANQHTDYLHLDEYIPEQSTKIQKILKRNIEDKDLLGSGQNGEFLVKTLEGMYGPMGLDGFQFARFTEEGKKALVRAFRTTLDTSSGTDNNRWTHRKFASLALKEMGIPGSAHYDRKSRWSEIDRADKTNNYVIWDEDIIEQLAVQPYSWRDRGHLEVDPTDHPLTDEYKPQ